MAENKRNTEKPDDYHQRGTNVPQPQRRPQTPEKPASKPAKKEE